MSHLLPCRSCQRHVRNDDEQCPFCGVGLSSEQRASAPPELPRRRLGRAALFTFGATMIGAAACSDGSGGGSDAGKDTPAADTSTDRGGSGGGGGGGGTGGQGGSGGGTGDAGAGDRADTGDSGAAGGSGGADGGRDGGGSGGQGGIAPPYGIAPLYGVPATDR